MRYGRFKEQSPRVTMRAKMTNRPGFTHALRFLVVVSLSAAQLPPAAAADSPSNIPIIGTIAALRAIEVTAATIHHNIQVQDYYGTSSGCPIQYKWNASDTATDNGGAVINPSGNAGAGRWNLNLPAGSPVHSCVFGIVADVTPNTGVGTDQSKRMQALLSWANSLGSNWVHIDGNRNKCIRINTPLNPGQGQIIEGDGEVNATGSISYGTCISYLGSTGYTFLVQTPHFGSGTVPYESPKFRDFTILYASPDTGSGGCVQLNSIAGGFTDTSASQQPLVHPQFKNIYCSLPVVKGSTKIGFQCSKCIDGVADQVSVFGGNVGFDLEGSENFTVRGPGSVTATFGPNIKLVSRGTFGNNNQVSNMQLLGPINLGQAVDSIIYDAARSSSLENNFLESLNGTPITSSVHLFNGFTAGIYNNAVTVSAIPWLTVDGVYNNITAYGNGGYGASIGAAIFHAGKYFYNKDVQSVLSHFGNGQNGDGGWPFNTVFPTDQILPPRTEGIWSPNYQGLSSNGYGLQEFPIRSAFTLPVVGAGNFLEFNINKVPSPRGVFDLQIHAWQNSGTGQITCQIEDGGSLVGNPIAKRITSSAQWYNLSFSQTVTTGAGSRCWNTGTGTTGNPLFLGQINLVDH
jgi:hypothetical protein